MADGKDPAGKLLGAKLDTESRALGALKLLSPDDEKLGEW